MTDTRREFIKKAALLTGAAGLFSAMPESIQKALAINAEKGSTYLDAEHIVFLMQENRSFDHTYGTLQGVRGFDDPRAMRLPNHNKVWLQTNRQVKPISLLTWILKTQKLPGCTHYRIRGITRLMHAIMVKWMAG